MTDLLKDRVRLGCKAQVKIVNGRKHRWVGIGWVDEGPAPITIAQRKILTRIADGERCSYRNGITLSSGWQFSRDKRVLNDHSIRTLMAYKMVEPKIEGSGFAKRKWLELTELGKEVCGGRQRSRPSAG